MPRTLLQLLLLVVVVVVIRSAQGRRKSMPLICSAAEHVVEDVTIIPITTRGSFSSLSSDVYVRPKVDFQGIAVMAQGQGRWREGAWFPLLEQCLSSRNAWFKLHVSVILKKSAKPHTLFFRVYCNVETMSCSKETTFQSLDSFQIEAHGPSNWNTTKTPICKVINYKLMPPTNSNLTCSSPPALSLQLPMPLLLAVVVGGLVVLVAVGMGLLAVYRKRRRASPIADTHPEASHPDTQLVHENLNNLHEPSSAFENRAVVNAEQVRETSL